MANLLDFTGKAVLVTGGRSGIGQAIAVAFAEQGASVGVMGRRPCDDTLAKIADAGSEGIYIQGDVSIASDMERAVDTMIDAYGKLDAAVNNAGLLPVTAPLIEQTEEDFQKIIDVDLKGIFLGMKYEIPALLANGGGAIVNLASVAGVVADPGMAPYVAAKHGVVGLTRAAGIEYAERNVRINCVAPGFVASEMTKGWMDDPEMCETVKGFNWAHRIADPKEIAGPVLLLASDAASFVSGAVWPVDAGQTAH